MSYSEFTVGSEFYYNIIRYIRCSAVSKFALTDFVPFYN